MEPPHRIFFGTRLNLGFSLFFPPAFLVMIWDLPFELAADVVMLPFDLGYYAYYLAKPPLSLLVEKHQNDRLEKMLKLGADPNKIDYRYYMPDWLPLFVAFQKDNSEAAKLLLEHGAKVTARYLYFFQGNHSNERAKIVLYALRTDIPKEMVQDKEAEFLVNQWVRRWIGRRIYNDKSDKHDGTLEFEVVSLLLKHGFPVNSIRKMNEERTTQKTALDEVLTERQLAPEDRDKMVALLRLHDAKTFYELAKEDTTLPHLDLSGIEIAPQFRPVVEILMHSKEAAGYRASNSCQGIDGPHLMFDYLPSKQLKEGYNHTKTINVHTRKALSKIEWNQECESVEIPEFYRIILTQKGRKVPSQIHSDWPREMVIREQWVTLETCEMYVAFNAERCPGQLLAYEDLEAIALTTVPREMSNYAARSNFQHLKVPMDYRFFTELFNFEKLFTGKLDSSIADSTEVQEFLKRANKKTAEKGLPGQWRFHAKVINNDSSFAKIKNEIVYFYSSRRTLEELANTPKPLAPFPNEILVLAHVRQPIENNNSNNKTSYSVDKPLLYDYGGYWRDATCGFGFEHGYAMIMCGDDAAKEAFWDIIEVLAELFK